MKLTFRQKALFITAVALIGWLAALYSVSSHIVMGRFARLERENVILNVKRAHAALSAQLDQLDSKAGDWSTWDDAYAFMNGENPDFIAKNVSDQNFIQLKLDLMAFVDLSNRVVFAKVFDDRTQKPAPFPDSLRQRLTHHDILVQHTAADSRHDGLLLLPDGPPLLIASRPILNTNRDKPIRGTLVFGQYLESDEIESLAETIHNPLGFYRLDAATMPADVVAASRHAYKPDDVIVVPLNSHLVAGCALIQDIYGQPALWLHLEMPRDIYAQGRLTMTYFLVALLIVSILFGTVAQIMLQKVVFHKLARKESEQRYRAVIEQAAVGILLVDSSGQEVLDKNMALQRLLRCTADELRSLQLRDIQLRDSTGASRTLDSLLTATIPYSGEQQVLRKDGTWAYVELSVSRISLGTSEIFSIGLHDISQRRQAQEELALRNRAIDAIGQGITISDPNQPDNPVIYVNAAFEKLTGYSRDEVVGRNWRFLEGSETDPAAVETIHNAERDRRPCLVQLLNYRKDGTKFWNSLIVSPLFDSTGRLVHFVGAHTDITSVKQLEEQLRQAQKMEAIGRLAGGVAHDFNNILTATIGYCELARDQVEATHPVRASIEEIAAAAERAASLTRQLLAFSRKQTLQPKVLDLNAVVGNMDKMLRRLLTEDIGFITKLAPDLGRVKADPGQIEQVLINLAVNARDAMPQGGKLIIETGNVALDDEYVRHHKDLKAGNYVRIAVTDTGTGMTQETKARMFEPFFTTKPQGQGTGLGLATCFGIVKQSDGHIAVYSELGHGTTFSVYLPRVEEPAAATLATPVTSAPRGGSETILLVEDDAAVRGLNARLLRAKGYTIIEANNGKEALRVADQRKDAAISLLLTDLIMPEMGGKELAERFHSMHPNTKVLFCSGYTQETIDRGGELEPDIAFLQKPFTPTVLASKIREVLES